MANIQDVARAAGVSTATVSHVLNGTRRVSQATRVRVEAAIEALHYRPSAVARGLSTRSTQTIGILVADITNPFYASVVRGVEETLLAHGYGLIVCNTGESEEREAAALKMLVAKRVDGLIVAPTGQHQDEFESLGHLGIPMVFIDRVPPRRVGPLVAIDNFAAGRAATQHLLDLGHRRIGIVARPPTVSTVTERVRGYRHCLDDHGVVVDPRLVVSATPQPEAALAAVTRLLRAPRPPTAVIAGNHVMAHAAVRAIQVEGIACPDDLSLVCFDDHPWAPLFTPPLTVVRMPTDDICSRAAHALLRAIAHRKEGTEAEAHDDVTLEATLVVRQSTRQVLTKETHA
jgi:LacI family transcriptional regulator